MTPDERVERVASVGYTAYCGRYSGVSVPWNELPVRGKAEWLDIAHVMLDEFELIEKERSGNGQSHT